jgi:small subunit ribosomal protein S6
MREYELYLVLDADAEEEEVNTIIEKLTQLITMGDGDAEDDRVKVEPRGKRRLAYPIRKKTESQDFIVSAQTTPQALPELERMLKLEERILRYLILRTGDK